MAASGGELAVLAAMLRQVQPAAAAAAELLMAEAARVAVLWEELWHATLQEVQVPPPSSLGGLALKAHSLTAEAGYLGS